MCGCIFQRGHPTRSLMCQISLPACLSYLHYCLALGTFPLVSYPPHPLIAQIKPSFIHAAAFILGKMLSSVPFIQKPRKSKIHKTETYDFYCVKQDTQSLSQTHTHTPYSHLPHTPIWDIHTFPTHSGEFAVPLFKGCVCPPSHPPSITTCNPSFPWHCSCSGVSTALIHLTVAWLIVWVQQAS